MLDRIQEIDTGAIEELTRIKRDQEVLEDRLGLMQERREGVSEVVFERVRGDYRRRLDALDEEARPLKERARHEYAKLRSLRDELQRSRDDVSMEKEEIEFRNGLGEFPGDEYERRAADCAERLAARTGELAEVEALRARFLASCRTAEELESVEPAPPTPVDAAPAGAIVAEPLAPAGAGPVLEEPFARPAAPDPGLGEAATAMAPLVADQEAVAVTLSPNGGAAAAKDEDALHEAPTGAHDLPPPPPARPADQPELEDGDELSGATRILSRPRLVEMDNGSSGREHPLALGRTSIGRASDNVVHLLDEAVSRHHAEIVPGPNGYLLRDLSSENGIYVNGERTREHVLVQGDVVQIGARTLVFYGA
ncbi:MAG TPA: FHA domain-containing protein [Thermoanaerobaculia bacterium]|jgi:hypothetical protein|nr:FHA domain-containing protein [Thermoanaerobaculia bacterium]